MVSDTDPNAMLIVLSNNEQKIANVVLHLPSSEDKLHLQFLAPIDQQLRWAVTATRSSQDHTLSQADKCQAVIKGLMVSNQQNRKEAMIGAFSCGNATSQDEFIFGTFRCLKYTTLAKSTQHQPTKVDNDDANFIDQLVEIVGWLHNIAIEKTTDGIEAFATYRYTRPLFLGIGDSLGYAADSPPYLYVVEKTADLFEYLASTDGFQWVDSTWRDLNRQIHSQKNLELEKELFIHILEEAAIKEASDLAIELLL